MSSLNKSNKHCTKASQIEHYYPIVILTEQLGLFNTKCLESMIGSVRIKAKREGSFKN